MDFRRTKIVFFIITIAFPLFFVFKYTKKITFSTKKAFYPTKNTFSVARVIAV